MDVVHRRQRGVLCPDLKPKNATFKRPLRYRKIKPLASPLIPDKVRNHVYELR